MAGDNFIFCVDDYLDMQNIVSYTPHSEHDTMIRIIVIISRFGKN